MLTYRLCLQDSESTDLVLLYLHNESISHVLASVWARAADDQAGRIHYIRGDGRPIARTAFIQPWGELEILAVGPSAMFSGAGYQGRNKVTEGPSPRLGASTRDRHWDLASWRIDGRPDLLRTKASELDHLPSDYAHSTALPVPS